MPKLEDNKINNKNNVINNKNNAINKIMNNK